MLHFGQHLTARKSIWQGGRHQQCAFRPRQRLRQIDRVPLVIFRQFDAGFDGSHRVRWRRLRDGLPQPDRIGAAIELLVEQAQPQRGLLNDQRIG
jgi:hypothetical protein